MQTVLLDQIIDVAVAKKAWAGAIFIYPGHLPTWNRNVPTIRGYLKLLLGPKTNRNEARDLPSLPKRETR
jgi:hypothetical protein